MLKKASKAEAAGRRRMDEHAAARLTGHLSLVNKIEDHDFIEHWHTVLVRAGNCQPNRARGLLDCLSAVVGNLVPRVLKKTDIGTPCTDTDDNSARLKTNAAIQRLELDILSAEIDLHQTMERALVDPASVEWPAPKELFKKIDRLDNETEKIRTAYLEASREVTTTSISLLRLHIEHLLTLPDMEAWAWIDSALRTADSAPTSLLKLVNLFETERLSRDEGSTEANDAGQPIDPTDGVAKAYA